MEVAQFANGSLSSGKTKLKLTVKRLRILCLANGA